MLTAVLDFEHLLDESVRLHGHLCPGQVLGVRMSLLGLREIGITDPRGGDRRSLMVFVEMDRCATDAVQSVTGCSLGKRTLRFMDYGKMAATFLNLRTGKAVRIAALDESRAAARRLFPEIENSHAAQVEAYKVLSDDELFVVRQVRVSLQPGDLPGRRPGNTACHACGEQVRIGKEIVRDGRTLCRACAGHGYCQSVD